MKTAAKTDTTWRWLLLYSALVAALPALKVLGLASYSWWVATFLVWVQWLLLVCVAAFVGARRLLFSWLQKGEVAL